MLDEPRLLAAHPWVARRPITVTEYHRMGEVGILGERDRVELIEGELVAMSPIGSYHHGTVNKLNHALVQIKAFGPDVLLVSLGLDTHEGDPISRFALKTADYFRMGAIIEDAKLPTLFTFEGGYNIEAIGTITVNVLQGFQDT